MKKKFCFLAIVIFIFFMNSLMAFSERVINSLEQLEERNGKLELEMPYKDGKENGKSKQYWENGNIMNEATYKNGMLEGPQKTYHENGVLKLEMTLKDERPIGDVLTYDEKGKLIGKERY